MTRPPSRRCLATLAVLGVCGALPAQLPPKRIPKPAPPIGSKPAKQETPRTRTNQQPSAPEWVTLSEYDGPTSRRAFAACDADGDDRLDVRECRRALTNMGTAIEPTGFRTLDANRNGFAHWDEFDRRYRRIIEQGDRFRFRPLRPFALPKPAKTPAAANRTERAVAVLMSLANGDDDPHVNRAEFIKLLQTLGQPAGTIALFPGLDADKSGALSEAEIKSVVQQFPQLLQLADNDGSGGGGGGGGKNTDPGESQPGTALSKADLAQQLRRMHPSLGRWSEEIFRSADQDGDGKISAPELDIRKK